MDLVGIPTLPRLPSHGRRPRGIQRQVHVRPDGAARRLRTDPARSRAGVLSQLLPTRRTLATDRRTPRRRRRTARAAPVTWTSAVACDHRGVLGRAETVETWAAHCDDVSFLD